MWSAKSVIPETAIKYKLQYNLTLSKEGFSVTMIIRETGSKSKNYTITVIKCFIEKLRKLKS